MFAIEKDNKGFYTFYKEREFNINIDTNGRVFYIYSQEKRLTKNVWSFENLTLRKSGVGSCTLYQKSPSTTRIKYMYYLITSKPIEDILKDNGWTEVPEKYWYIVPVNESYMSTNTIIPKRGLGYEPGDKLLARYDQYTKNRRKVEGIVTATLNGVTTVLYNKYNSCSASSTSNGGKGSHLTLTVEFVMPENTKNVVRYAIESESSGSGNITIDWENKYPLKSRKIVPYSTENLLNTRPTTPPTISYTIDDTRAHDKKVITWGASTDDDGDPITYQLEFYNGTDWEVIYKGPERKFVHTIPELVILNGQYRVCANDGYQLSEYYRIGKKFSIYINNIPTIYTNVKNLNRINYDTTIKFSVDDADLEDDLTVNIYINSTKMKTIEHASRTTEYSFTITRDMIKQYSELWKDSQFIITCTDDRDEAKTIIPFVRMDEIIEIKEKVYNMETLAEKVNMVCLLKKEPNDKLEILVTNNANDSEPVWENTTPSVMNGIEHYFTNRVCTTTPAVSFIVKITKWFARDDI